MIPAKRARLAAVLAGGLLAGPWGAVRAQSPLTGDIVLAARLPGAYFETTPVTACDGLGACVFVWSGFYDLDSQRVDVLAAVLSADGEVRVPAKQLLSTHSLQGAALVVGLPDGFAVLHEDQSGVGEAVLQSYDEQLEPQGAEIRVPVDALDPRNVGLLAIARTTEGFAIFVAVIDAPVATTGLSVAFIDRNGQVIRRGVDLNTEQNVQWSYYVPITVGVQPDGALIAVYWRSGASSGGVYLRRISVSGQLLGPEVRVSRGGLDRVATVAAARDGTFMVVWVRSPRPDSTEEIVAQRFSARGRPLGKVFRINELFGLSQRWPAVTIDANDHYFVAWERFRSNGSPGWDVEGRWLDEFGVPLTRELRLSQQRIPDQSLPTVAGSAANTVMVGWGSDAFSEKGSETDGVPVARVFAIPR